MYGVLTTGKPVRSDSKIGVQKPAHQLRDRDRHAEERPVVHKDVEIEWDKDHGTRVEIEMEATYKKGPALGGRLHRATGAREPARDAALPRPEGGRASSSSAFAAELPRASKEIKPHPYGVELGILLRMLKDTGRATCRACCPTISRA
jgi:DNA topoisomerase-6 subunit B